jgi:thioredoxin-like negative regulator of GroEL
MLVQAVHDQDTARYNYAAIKMTQILKQDPGNTIALLHLGQTQLALGQTEKSEQTLAQAAEKGTPETRTLALSNIKSLRESEARFTLTRPNLAPLRASLDAAQARESQALTTPAATRSNRSIRASRTSRTACPISAASKCGAAAGSTRS